MGGKSDALGSNTDASKGEVKSMKDGGADVSLEVGPWASDGQVEGALPLPTEWARERVLNMRGCNRRATVGMSPVLGGSAQLQIYDLSTAGDV